MIPIILLVIALTAAPSAQEPRFDMTFENMTVSAIADGLAKSGGFEIRVAPEIRDKRLTLSVVNLPASSALELLAKEAECELTMDGTVWVLTPKRYHGKPISLDLKDAPLEDILRLFHEISGMNFAVHPEIEGKVTSVDFDNVPWDQALDLIARTEHLDVVYEGNTVLVGPSGIVPSELTLEEGQIGVVFGVFVGERESEPGVRAEEVLPAGGLTVVDAQWAQDAERQARQFQEAFGLSDVSLVSAPRVVLQPGEPATIETRFGDQSFALEATAWPGPGDKPKQVRVRAALSAWGREIGTTDVLATVGRPFTLAGRDEPTGRYLFLSATPWVGPVGEGRFGLARGEDLDKPPKKIAGEAPSYPEELRKNGTQGRALLDLTVEKNGEVIGVESLYADHPAFQEAAETAVRTWRYEPGLRGGQPVRFRATVKVEFKLK